MLTFLHLSDLHITTTDAGTQFDRDAKIREALLEDLGKEGRTAFDAILVTGDIAYHGRAEEFARTKAWLEHVRTITGSSPEALFVVPGNHDVNHAALPKDSSLWELHQSLRKPMPDENRLASLELKFLKLFQSNGFAPERQAAVAPQDGQQATSVADFAVREKRLAIYIDGAAFHVGQNKRRDQFIRGRLEKGTPPWKVVVLTAIDLKRGKELVDSLTSAQT